MVSFTKSHCTQISNVHHVTNLDRSQGKGFPFYWRKYPVIFDQIFANFWSRKLSHFRHKFILINVVLEYYTEGVVLTYFCQHFFFIFCRNFWIVCHQKEKITMLLMDFFELKGLKWWRHRKICTTPSIKCSTSYPKIILNAEFARKLNVSFSL